jgi:hypothetical protein
VTEQAGLPGMVSAGEHEADLREREDDPTPRGTAAAVVTGAEFSWLRDPSKLWMEKRPVRVLDVCAGYGCWASEWRRWWTLSRTQDGMTPWPCHITGAEIDDRKRDHLAKWCDAVRFGDVRDYLRWLIKNGSPSHFDLAIGNPAFSLLVPKQRSDETVEAAAERSILGHLLAVSPAVIQLHHTAAFARGKVGRFLWRRYTPARQWLIPGAVSFRSDGKTDSRCYAASLWLRGHTGSTAVEMLPELGREELRWRVLPGTEEPSDDLPAAPDRRTAA